MKRSRFKEERIVHALRRQEAGEQVKDIVRELGVTEQTFYQWRKKYAGLGVTELKNLKQQDDEITRLKKPASSIDILLSERTAR